MLYLTIVIAANKHEPLHRTNLFVFWQVTSFYSLFVAIKHRCFIKLIWFIEIRAIAPSSRASEWCMHVISVNASDLNLLDSLRHFHKVKFITIFKYSSRFRASSNKNCSFGFATIETKIKINGTRIVYYVIPILQFCLRYFSMVTTYIT